MTSHNLFPLPDDVRALIDAERGAPAGGAAARAAVRAKLGASLAAGAGGTAGGFAATLKVIAIVVGVTTAGVGVAHLARSERATPRAPVTRAISADINRRPAPTAMSVPVSLPPPVIVTPITPSPIAHASAPARRIAAAPPAPPPPVTSPPPSEASLIADAWRAHAAHDDARALDLVEESARLYSDGALGEERDALHIAALDSLGRADQARALARAFLASHPASIHRALAEAALHQESP